MSGSIIINNIEDFSKIHASKIQVKNIDVKCSLLEDDDFIQRLLFVLHMFKVTKLTVNEVDNESFYALIDALKDLEVKLSLKYLVICDTCVDSDFIDMIGHRELCELSILQYEFVRCVFPGPRGMDDLNGFSRAFAYVGKSNVCKTLVLESCKCDMYGNGNGNDYIGRYLIPRYEGFKGQGDIFDHFNMKKWINELNGSMSMDE